jgi:Asp-tRNA(Asn)/Glu-tRNA(Gln) amidotransferase A subunit family amidase
MSTWIDRSATELADLVRRGEVTCEELTRTFLERIEDLDEQLGAWELVEPEVALRYAREANAMPSEAPMRGVPIGVKDIFDTADLPTAYGSPIYAGHRPAADAEAVRRLREAGAVVLGKTVTTEFAAVTTPAKTRNPFDPERTPGGSSSGSAAAVAAGMVPGALGTQTAGSIVRPASYCGVFGYKPTFGLIGTRGMKHVARSLDTVGVFAGNVDDIELQARALGGYSSDAAPAAGPPRIAVIRTGRWEAAEAPIRAAVEDVADRLASAGAAVELLAVEPEFDELVDAAAVILQVEVAREHAEAQRAHPGLLSDAVLELVERGRATPPDAHENALALTDRWRSRVDAILGGFSCALTPSVTGEPPARDTTGDPLFCRTWTLLGTPAISVPFARSATGLPLGMQLVAPRSADAQLLVATRWAAEVCLDGTRAGVI